MNSSNRLLILMLGLCCGPITGRAQCTMTASFHSRLSCGPLYEPVQVVEVYVSGGSAPYTFHYQSFSQVFNSLFTVVAIPVSLGCWQIAMPGSYPCSVTDALGCVAQGTTTVDGYERASRLHLANQTNEYVPQPDGTVDFVVGPGSCDYGALSSSSQAFYNNLNYSIQRDQSFYSSGAIWDIFDPVTHQITFQNLPDGVYTFTISGNSNGYSQQTPRWCQDMATTTRYIPHGNDTGVNLRLSACLGGAMRSGSTDMVDSLRTHGLLPLVEPYSAMGYTYVGASPGASMEPSLLSTSGISAVVDWVVVELRDPSSSYSIVASRPALIRRNGQITDTDGDWYVNFPNVTAGYYTAAVRHRNHLGAMHLPGNQMGFLASVIIPLRTSSTYGTSAETSINGVKCLWPGDVNSDGTIRYVGANNDRDLILGAIGGSTPTNVVNNVYSPLDVNMDGNISYVGANNDRDPILTTVGGTVPTATRVQQLP